MLRFDSLTTSPQIQLHQFCANDAIKVDYEQGTVGKGKAQMNYAS